MVFRSGWPISSRISLQVRCARDEVGGEGDVELHAHRLQPPAGLACFLDAEIGQARVLPAGEQVLEVPFALAVAGEDEKAVHVQRLRCDRSLAGRGRGGSGRPGERG